MTIGERIRHVRGAMSQEEFARKIDASKTAVGAYERDTSKPGADAILSICTQFSIEPRWLLTGQGPMAAGASALIAQPEPVCDVDMIYVPLVEARLSAGTGSFETGENADQEHLRRYGFRSDFLSRKGSIAHMVLMRVVGDSMEPEIHHGDVVLIDQSQTTPTPGALFAVGIMDMVYIKAVDALPGKIVLKSSNPQYGPIEWDARGDMADCIRIIGRAIWLGRELR